MPVSNLPIFPQTIVDFSTILVNANGVATVAFVAGGTNGTKIESMVATSNNTTDLGLDVWVNNGGADTLLAAVYVPANSGALTPNSAVNVLSNVPGLASDANGNKYIYVASGTTLKVSSNVAVAAGKAMGVWASGGNY